MVLKLTFALEEDATHIADIHMAAFAANKNLLTQFPTDQVRDGLRTTVAQKAFDDIRDPHTAVLLIQDTELNDKTISFAKWSLPSSTAENEVPWIWPQGARLDLLETWTETVEGTKAEVLGDQLCYCTEPHLIRRCYICSHS